MEPKFSFKVYTQGQQKRETKVQWLIEEGEQKELYDDLGIIGELSPDAGSSNLSATAHQIRKANKCGLIKNCKQLNFETPSSADINMDVKLKRAINRMQRKRSRHNSKLGAGFSHAKIGKMDLSDTFHASSRETKLYSDMSLMGKLPDEVLLKIFQLCNSNTRVLCSRVCWRWYHIVNDESLWKQISLAKQTTNLYQLQQMFKRGVQVLCLNCATVSQNTQDNPNTSSSMFDDNSSFTARPRSRLSTYPCSLPHANFTQLQQILKQKTGEMCLPTMSPRLDPFSRQYNYCVHSLDFTNANISPNILCLILTRCNKLRNLSLEGLTINHIVLGSLTSCLLLERLNVCLCHDMTMSGLTLLLTACSKIVELNLGWTNLCRADPIQIIQALPVGLGRLNLSGFRDTLKDSHIVEMLKRCPSLVEVDVSDSNLLTGYIVDQMILKLSNTLRAVNLSRCYSITPNCFLRFSRLPQLRYLDVFGVMDDSSIGTLATALPRVRVCLRPFSAISRPSPSALYGTKRRTVWGYLVV